MPDTYSSATSPRRIPHAKRRRPPLWPKGADKSETVLMALINLSDGDGRCSPSLSDLAEAANRSIETTRNGIARLIAAGCIGVEKAGRDGDGMFGPSNYTLRLERTDVFALFAFYRPSGPENSPYPEFRETGKTGCGNAGEPQQETSSGPYKDSRARPRASQSIIYHSIPDNHGIEDNELAEQVAEALSCCGQGTEGVETEWLIESLAHHIPIALEKGYSFERDILACIRFYTRYKRAKPLNRFDVTFREDLPKWTADRLKRKAKRQENIAGANSPASSIVVGSAATSSSDQLDRFIQRRVTIDDSRKRADRIFRCRRVIAVFDSQQEAEISSLKFELPQDQRDLSGAQLIEALRPIVESYRMELGRLLSD